MPNHLLFYAYTGRQVAECRYFLLKYLALYNLKPPAAIIPVIYTNQPNAFESFTSFFARFQMPELLAAEKPVAVTQLTKTDILQQFFLQNNGAVLYCDTNTYPLQPLEALFSDLAKGGLYLHAPQRMNETNLLAATRKLTAQKDKTATATATPTSAHMTVYNTAVIGLNESHKELIATVAQQTAGATNELAFNQSYTKHFGNAGTLKSAEKYIYEYSRLKEFDYVLQTFFTRNEEESIPNQVKLVHHLDAAVIQQQKEAFQKQPFFKKWLQTITGKQWRIRQYTDKL